MQKKMRNIKILNISDKKLKLEKKSNKRIQKTFENDF